MKGFYCLTWRLADAIDPKISYIANAVGPRRQVQLFAGGIP